MAAVDDVAEMAEGMAVVVVVAAAAVVVVPELEAAAAADYLWVVLWVAQL